MNTGHLPFVSIIIPCRNEEGFISACLDSLLSQDYPQSRMEVIVVDGASQDRTPEIVRAYAARDSRVRMLKNPHRFTPISMNIGLRNAKGDILAKTDAHTAYAPDYVSRCIRHFNTYPVDAVGGVIKTLPAKNTLAAKAIALVLSSFWGAGNSYFRTGIAEPRLADTAFGIFYRKEVFLKIGAFNERLKRSQDIEFNMRLVRAGGKILLAPDMISTYYPKATLREFLLHNIEDGAWAILPSKFGVPLLKARHFTPLLFVLGASLSTALALLYPEWRLVFLAPLIFYAAITALLSMKMVFEEKDILLFPVLIIAFLIRHFAYGIGSLIGIFKLLV